MHDAILCTGCRRRNPCSPSLIQVSIALRSQPRPHVERVPGGVERNHHGVRQVWGKRVPSGVLSTMILPADLSR